MRVHELRALAGVVAAGATVLACGTLAQLADATTEEPNLGAPPTGANKPADDRTDKNITITPVDMDFKELPCGTESGGTLITIHNGGAAKAPYKVVIADGTAFRIDGVLEGTVDPGALIKLNVFAKPGIAGENATDLVVSAGNAVQSIHVKAQGTGATFELLPASVSFGDARMQNGAGPIDVEVFNRGTEAVVMMAYEQSADFTVTFDGGPLKIAPREKGILHTTLKGASMPSGPLQAALKPVLTQTLCGAAPLLTLQGRRVNSNVTLSSGDFQKQDCTSQPGAKDIVISNYSTNALNYNATLAATSAFTITSGATGTVPAGTTTTPGTSRVKVQPKPFGTNVTVIQEDLTVDITNLAAPDGGPRKVPLRVDVRGAIVTITPVQLGPFSSNGTNTDTKPFTVQNSGNEPIYLYWYLQRTKGGPAWNVSPPSSIQPGQTKTGTVGFTPTTDGASEANVIPVRTSNFFGQGGVSCTPLTSILVQGTKTN